MIGFVQDYGLWIVLASVFFAMHWFGMGCCGGGHRHRLARRDDALPDDNGKSEKAAEPLSKSDGSCH